MAHPSVAALEAAVQAVRDRDLPLAARLHVIADAYLASAPLYAEAAQRLIERLEAVGAGAGAPGVGEVMPGFVMPDQDGRLISLASLLEQGPVVLVLHRGHWCPYCRVSVAGLAQIQDRIGPAQLVAMSAETQAYTRRLRAEAGASFPILTDLGAGYALSLNLAIWIDEAMSRMIDRTGRNVPSFQGGGDWVLPIPAVFVIGADGIVAVRHVDPDYRRRMDLDALLAAVARVVA